ncbi:sensor histidine kinase [Cohnella sp. GCM10027633]|uniref:sensor histidine kinase n=1 Tax=unclassified Cohnella TaxID=2636738 RepID=UPI0036453EDA
MPNASSLSLFDRMRRKLTLQYSGVLIVFLTLFVVIVYVLLYWLIWNDQRSRLSELADGEIRVLQDWADHDDNPNRLPPRSVEDAFAISADQSFYYLIAENGNVQLGGETQPKLRSQVMELIGQGRFLEQRIEKVTLRTFDDPSANELVGATAGGNAKFLVTDRDLLWNGERIGKLYVGKEVTFQHDLFRYLLVLLIGLALAFFALALWLSHYMSRKATVPVARSYDRQREFVADASHELRTPLSVLLTSIEALQLELDTEKGEFVARVLDGMKEEVQSITKLTGNLMRLARSDSGDSALEYASFDVRQAAISVVDKLRPLALARGIDVEAHVPDELKVEWDEEKIVQLLVLLIENAIKYTSSGGSVVVTLADVRAKGERSLTIEVKDNGMGISQEALPRIFDRFYRQDKARTRQTGGHGLGLAIAKDIVDRGRGTILVDSKEGEGSTFKVWIPLPGQ